MSVPNVFAISLLSTILLILLINERIGHAGNVVADHARQRFLRGFFAVAARQVVGLFHPVGEELSGNALGVFLLGCQRRTVVKVFVESLSDAGAPLRRAG